MIFRRDEDIMMMNLLKESPQECEDNVDVSSEISEDFLRELVSEYKPSASTPYGPLYISKNSKYENSYNYYIIDNNYKLLMFYNFILVKPDYIISKIASSSKDHLGIFEMFFINYLMVRYKTVECDSLLSTYGMKFWKKILLKYPRLHFYVVDSINNNVICNPTEDDFSKHYGQNKSFRNYKFVASSIKRTADELLAIRRECL